MKDLEYAGGDPQFTHPRTAMAPARNMQEKGPELTVETIHLPTRWWQLWQQSQIVAPFNKASEAQIPHLIYQQDTQITARTADTLSGLPAGIIWERHCMGHFGVAHQSLLHPFLTLSFHKTQFLTQLGAEINGSASQSEA